MLKIIKESFNITNGYLVFLATPLILFSFLSSLYLIFSSNGGKIGLIFSVILFLLMLSAFVSGWLYMIANSVKNTDFDSKKSLIVEFPSGVGEYFLPMLGMIMNVLIISGLIFLVSHYIGNHCIGDVNISAEALRKAQASPEAARLFYESLSKDQLTKLAGWFGLSFIDTLICCFIFMFYSASVIFKSKNPFMGLLISLKDLFSSKFIKNLFLFGIIIISYFFIAIITTIFSFNLFLQFIFNLINFYYAVFITVFVFNYYYSNFVKIGSNIDVNV